MVNHTDAEAVLIAACLAVNLRSQPATLLRAGENTLFVIPEKIVARVTRNGQVEVARKEVNVSRWLGKINFPVVQALDLQQPVMVADRAVTFWHQLPTHRPGTPAEVGEMLKRLHALQLSGAPDLPHLNPLVRLAQRIDESRLLLEGDRTWLRSREDMLTQRWRSLPEGRPWCAVHGDAWGSNFVATSDRVIMLDLERFAYGPPEWDLTAIAVDHETFGSVSSEERLEVVRSYGLDVMRWPGYPILRDIRELRKVTFAFQTAEYKPGALEQARYRLSCIKGQEGPRPWNWAGVV